jgi:tRNA-specific 2-thiouridylase
MQHSDLVIVGMSGGVDSSVAAARLIEAGHSVQGLFMSNWDADEDGYCTAAADYQDARRVCALLGIPLHRVDFAREYRERVFEHFLTEYRAGRTPNPDVVCNREIKFGVFYEYARRLGAGWIATGHYARIEHAPRLRLLKAVDTEKDQTYFLHAARPEALARTLFPLGSSLKQLVRLEARERGLPVHDKRDSTGICFIGERPFAAFLEQFLPARPGIIESEDGQQLGEHRGLMFYTLGQRKGLGLGGQRGAGEAPWYVVRKDIARNVLVVSQIHDARLLLAQRLAAATVEWLAPQSVDLFRCTARTRHRQPEQDCTVRRLAPDRCEVEFDRPQRAVTPGQYVVFYDREECLGGGVIAAVEPIESGDSAHWAATPYPSDAQPL